MVESLPMILLAGSAGILALMSFVALRWNRIRPAAAFVLISYLPFQNILLPLLFQVGGFGAISPLLPAKEILAVVGILESVTPGLAMYRLRFADVLASGFAAYLVVNAVFSPADAASVGHGLRDFSVPLLLYLFGRASWYSGSENTSRFMRLTLVVGVVVAIFGIVEYGLSLRHADPFNRLQIAYFDQAYGHGSPASDRRSQAFLDLQTLGGTFGNNLMIATYLRSVLCVFLAYFSYCNRKPHWGHLCCIALVTAACVLTFSRYAIAFLLILFVVLLVTRRPLVWWQKLVAGTTFLAVIVASAPALMRVAETTVNVEDQSTHSHVESLLELKDIEVSLMGEGLGRGTHSQEARSIYRDTGGEGIFRQDLPEIGILGVFLLLAFTVTVISGLMLNARVGPPHHRWHYVWIAVPLMTELLRSPFDIGLRSFLGTGTAWFFSGWFLSERTR
jgi:hypothetical protein